MTSKESCEKAKPAHEALMKFYPLTLEDLPDEIWLPIPDYEELYHVSNYGRIKSFHKGKQKIMKPLLKRKYLHVGLRKKNSKQKWFPAHRLVALCFIPNPQNKPQVNHKDGHKLNNHVSNLEWVTASENTKHSFDNGLQVNPQGEDCSWSKLTAEQVRSIRENPEGLTTYALADLFGVSQGKISDVQLGKSYRNAGGVIRQKCRIPDNVRVQIRAEYVYGSAEFGCYGLAKKYGIDPKTIFNIVHEG